MVYGGNVSNGEGIVAVGLDRLASPARGEQQDGIPRYESMVVSQHEEHADSQHPRGPEHSHSETQALV